MGAKLGFLDLVDAEQGLEFDHLLLQNLVGEIMEAMVPESEIGHYQDPPSWGEDGEEFIAKRAQLGGGKDGVASNGWLRPLLKYVSKERWRAEFTPALPHANFSVHPTHRR